MRFPRNEEETIELYQLAQYRLGWPIVHLQRECPDAIIAKNGYELRAEFEYNARNFKAHGHDPDDCDLIICWHNNWRDAPLPVWSLEEDASREADMLNGMFAGLAPLRDFVALKKATLALEEANHSLTKVNDFLRRERAQFAAYSALSLMLFIALLACIFFK